MNFFTSVKNYFTSSAETGSGNAGNNSVSIEMQNLKLLGDLSFGDVVQVFNTNDFKQLTTDLLNEKSEDKQKESVEKFIKQEFSSVFKDNTDENALAKKYLNTALRAVVIKTKGKVDAVSFTKELASRTVKEYTEVQAALEIAKQPKGAQIDKLIEGLSVFVDSSVDKVLSDQGNQGLAKRVIKLMTGSVKWIYQKYKIAGTTVGLFGGASMGFAVNFFLNNLLTEKVPSVTTYGWTAIFLGAFTIAGVTVGISVDILLCIIKKNNSKIIGDSQQRIADLAREMEANQSLQKKIAHIKDLFKENGTDLTIGENSENNLIHLDDSHLSTHNENTEEKIVVNE